ncbi:hypothetical protein CEXT_212181 [Caerostris extrusa]|uniref:Uncharacterized protein n=1 Tax=Caerostris extrusa TaxID=172846 RepID=A0AAV4UP78_CAEEX|nr:hypothetical protein CEXT_212181 [Caerostris extrusa]
MSSVEEDPEMVSVEDDSEMVSIEEDPEMSDVEEFGRKLFMHCLNSFGVVKNPHVESSLFTDEIGDIVVSLQAVLTRGNETSSLPRLSNNNGYN